MSLSHWTTQRIESPAHWRLLNRRKAVYKNTKFSGYFDLKYHCWNMQLSVNSSWRLVFSVLVNVLKKKSAFVVHIWNEWKNRNSVSADWIYIFFQVINYSWLWNQIHCWMPFWKEFQLQISPKIIIITENLQSPSPFLYTCTYVRGISMTFLHIYSWSCVSKYFGKKKLGFFCF